jgi:hypothetical protein
MFSMPSSRSSSRTKLSVVDGRIDLGSMDPEELRQKDDPKVVYRVKLKQYIKAAAEVITRRVYSVCTYFYADTLVRIANGFPELRSPAIVRM